jgi:hypothetical protein
MGEMMVNNSLVKQQQYTRPAAAGQATGGFFYFTFLMGRKKEITSPGSQPHSSSLMALPRTSSM